jgi:phosphatidylserine/phosphatidylglycerophosphate/cardiolipin synthase-like enzyme
MSGDGLQAGVPALLALLAIAVVLGLLAVAHGRRRRPMPAGLSVASPLLPGHDITFLVDLTYRRHGVPHCHQEIWPAIQAMIAEAESFIVLDIFLYNDLQAPGLDLPPLSRQLTEALLRAKEKRPGLDVWLITDPANTGYGSHPNPSFERLKAAGGRVVLTNLDALPDSNLLYAGFHRLVAPLVPKNGRAWLPSPFTAEAPPFTLAAWLALFNFKANHRKIVLTEKAGLVTSANPSHDASAANSNIAVRCTGPILAELLKSEQAVTALSGINLAVDPVPPPAPMPGPVRLQLLTEGKIKAALLADLDSCRAPATLWLAMFYLADRQVVAALLAAARRGITVRLILDANRDAFGHKKNGVPNQPVAAWLTKKSAGRIRIRWYASHAEQFHSKLVLLVTEGTAMVLAGSANLTRRNIGDYNLESCLRLIGPAQAPVNQQVRGYFERLWHNRDGDFTLDYGEGADPSPWKYWQYQFQERTGLSMF